MSKLTLAKTIFLSTVIFNLPNTALAQQLPTDSNAKLQVGISAGYTANAYQTNNTLSVLPYAFYDNNRLYLEGGEAGVYAYKDKQHQLRAGLAYEGHSFDPKEATTEGLKQLNERKASITAHASHMVITPIGGIRTKISKNLGKDGMAVSLSHLSRFEYQKATIYPSFGLTWHDKKYNRYYYGIDTQEAQKSNLPSYRPNDSLSPFVSLTVMYDLTERLGIMGSQRLEWLSNEQKNSPMSDGNLQSTTRVGISYKF